jgi:hypothetical protein
MHKILLPLLALAPLLACDLFNKVDADKAEQLIQTILDKESIKAEKITCPDGQSSKKGTSFECTAVVSGAEVHFTVEMVDDAGTALASPRDHTFPVAKLEPEIADNIRELGHTVAKLDCHGELWVAVKGAVVTCDVTDEAGAQYLWTAEFTDNEGGHSHKLEPKAT